MKIKFNSIVLVILFLLVGVAKAQENSGQTKSTQPSVSCSVTGSNGGFLPGITNGSGVCESIDNPAYGISCGSGNYYNGSSCVSLPSGTNNQCSDGNYYSNGSSCVLNNSACTTSDNGAGAYKNGICTAHPQPEEVKTPTLPSGELSEHSKGMSFAGAPTGQQPVCLNSSPTVGFVVGSVLCYGTAADTSGTEIYGYKSRPSDAVDPLGWITTGTWDSLQVQDLYATGNITAHGSLKVLGGALITSKDGQSGLVVKNNNVYMQSGNAFIDIAGDSNKIILSTSDGGKTASQTIFPDAISSYVGNGNDKSQMGLTSQGVFLQSSTGQGASAESASLDLSAGGMSFNALNSEASTEIKANAGEFEVKTSGVTSSSISMDQQFISLVTGGVGKLATNGTSGTTSGNGSGGIQVSQIAQDIAVGTTVGDLLAGKQYQNKVNGNMFVDGNVYINGELAYVSSTAANTTVKSDATSVLGTGLTTSGATSIVMKGTDAMHSVVDANGRVSLVEGVSEQSSASVTVTNGLGNVHGLFVNEEKATLSGGVYSTSMTLDDNGATFSDAATGMPVQVHGVADGTADFDAVNYRQLRSVAAGVASATAIANLPPVDAGKRFSFGVGMGDFQGLTSVAIGMSVRPIPNMVTRLSVATVRGQRRSTTVGAGMGFSW